VLIKLVETVHFPFDSLEAPTADGAVCVLDCVEGVLIAAQHFPLTKLPTVLFLNKLDRMFVELNISLEDFYQTIARCVDEAGTSPFTTLFGSARGGWGFTLDTFARIYALRFPSIPDMRTYLWGEHYFEYSTKTWHPTSGVGRERGFSKLVGGLIATIYMRALDSQAHPDLVERMLTFSGLSWPEVAKQRLHGRRLGDAMLAQMFPLSRAFVQVSQFLPGPK